MRTEVGILQTLTPKLVSIGTLCARLEETHDVVGRAVSLVVF